MPNDGHRVQRQKKLFFLAKILRGASILRFSDKKIRSPRVKRIISKSICEVAKKARSNKVDCGYLCIKITFDEKNKSYLSFHIDLLGHGICQYFYPKFTG